MHQSIHQQLIRGIQGLNPAQARQLQDLLAAVKGGSAVATPGVDDGLADSPASAGEPDTDVGALADVEAMADIQAEAAAGIGTDVDVEPVSEIQAAAEVEAVAGALPIADADVSLDAVTAVEIDGDLPQPVCAQEDRPAAATRVWGPPPLSGINFEQMHLIASLVREANEARNARRQRYGL